MKKSFFIILALFLLILTGCANNVGNTNQPPVEGQILNNSTTLAKATGSGESSGLAGVKNKAREVVEDSIEVAKETVVAVKLESGDLEETFDQDMDFARQAPGGQWEVEYFQEACEEASLIMIWKFFRQEYLDEAVMETELRRVESWELDRFGANLSINTEEVAAMAREFYGLNAEVSSDVTVNRIKKELVAGNLVILPLTGREIGNPNFTGEGPLYHMLVVKGYDRDQFITNDPGTRLGKNYKYEYDVLISAAHDWNDGDIYNGKRVMLIISK